MAHPGSQQHLLSLEKIHRLLFRLEDGPGARALCGFLHAEHVLFQAGLRIALDVEVVVVLGNLVQGDGGRDGVDGAKVATPGVDVRDVPGQDLVLSAGALKLVRGVDEGTRCRRAAGLSRQKTRRQAARAVPLKRFGPMPMIASTMSIRMLYASYYHGVAVCQGQRGARCRTGHRRRRVPGLRARDRQSPSGAGSADLVHSRRQW